MSIFEKEFVVRPGENGSFLVADRGADHGMIGSEWGFTDIIDLLGFMKAEAGKLPCSAVQPSKTKQFEEL